MWVIEVMASLYWEMLVNSKPILPHSLTHSLVSASPPPTSLIQFLKFNFLLTVLLPLLSHTNRYF